MPGAGIRLLVPLFILVATAAHAGPAPPNFLLLMAEDMSPRVGAFGDPVARTPNLDRLAAEGVRYTRVFTTAGVCAPSRAAHILGMHQVATGTQHMRTSSAPGGAYLAVPPAGVKAYPELLREAGYYTYTDSKLDYQFSGPYAGSGPFTIWDEEGTGPGAWRDRPPGQPFFALRNFLVTHESGVFTPLGTLPHSGMQLLLQLFRWWQLDEVAAVTDPAAVRLPPYYPDTPTVRQDVARHYDNIAQMDAEVGELLAQLAADGLADSTIVIWTTDHGDGLPRAKRELFDAGIHVPMIIRWPAAYRPAGVEPGSVDRRLISFVDLAPTILKLAGVTPPEYLHGQDFADLAAAPRQYVYAQRDRIDEVVDRQRAVRDRRFKYIRSWYPDLPGGHPLAFRDNIDMVREMRALYAAGQLDAVQRDWFEPPGTEQLYDLDRDPFEVTDLSADPRYGADLIRLRRALEQRLARIGDWSEDSEAEMARRFQPHGSQLQTPSPRGVIQGGVLFLEADTAGASLAYRRGSEERWQLYRDPVRLTGGGPVMARAVRYGWLASEEIQIEPEA